MMIEKTKSNKELWIYSMALYIVIDETTLNRMRKNELTTDEINVLNRKIMDYLDSYTKAEPLKIYWDLFKKWDENYERVVKICNKYLGKNFLTVPRLRIWIEEYRIKELQGYIDTNFPALDSKELLLLDLIYVNQADPNKIAEYMQMTPEEVESAHLEILKKMSRLKIKKGE